MIFCVEDDGDFGEAQGIPIQELSKRIGDEVLDMEGVRDPSVSDRIEVSLYLVGEDAIRELNLMHRNINDATDVLSFPNMDLAGMDAASALSQGDADSIDPETGHLILGEIVINVARVIRQAESYGHSVRREFSFLLAHSLFHLLGYDHMDQAEAKVMEEKQEAVLTRLGITREEG